MKLKICFSDDINIEFWAEWWVTNVINIDVELMKKIPAMQKYFSGRDDGI